MKMSVTAPGLIPLELSLAGLVLEPIITTKQNNCPHRGRVWGAYIPPLFAVFYAHLLLRALQQINTYRTMVSFYNTSAPRQPD